MGNNLNYGTLIAYIDEIECGRIKVDPMFNYDINNLKLSNTLEDLNKEVILKLEIEDVLIDVVSSIQLVANGEFNFNNVELTVSNLPILIKNLEIEYNNQILLDNIVTVNTGDTNNVLIKVYGIYSDDSKKDITVKCEYGGTGNTTIKLINPGEFKIMQFVNHQRVGVRYGGIDKDLYFNIIDISPSLLESSIQDNVINIPIDNTNIFTFKFDKQIQQGNNFGSISLLNSDGNPCGITKVISGDTLTITPIVNLKYDSDYILYIPTGSIKNLGTQSNTEDLIYHFKTVAENITPTALLKTISVGETSIDVIPTVKTYNFTLPAGTTIAPSITVTKGDTSATINIPAIEIIPGSVEITVRSADGTKVETYVINLTLSEVDNCFIATATYGSLLEPHVVVLRQFRDNVLMKFDIGKWFIRNYYLYSPPIANVVRDNEGLKFGVRMVLTPVILIIEYWLWLIVGLIGFGVIKFKYRLNE